MKKKIEKKLDKKDRKEIRYLIRVSLIVILSFSLIASIMSTLILYNSGFTFYESLIGFPAAVLLAAIVFFLINRKYITDLRIGSKTGYIYPIEYLEETTDYGLGTGGGIFFSRNKTFIRYDIIVNNVRYKIDEKLHKQLRKNDPVVIYYTNNSKYRLEIEKYIN